MDFDLDPFPARRRAVGELAVVRVLRGREQGAHPFMAPGGFRV
jgi:hypothetical protein